MILNKITKNGFSIEIHDNNTFKTENFKKLDLKDIEILMDSLNKLHDKETEKLQKEFKPKEFDEETVNLAVSFIMQCMERKMTNKEIINHGISNELFTIANQRLLEESGGDAKHIES